MSSISQSLFISAIYYLPSTSHQHVLQGHRNTTLLGLPTAFDGSRTAHAGLFFHPQHFFQHFLATEYGIDEKYIFFHATLSFASAASSKPVPFKVVLVAIPSSLLMYCAGDGQSGSPQDEEVELDDEAGRGCNESGRVLSVNAGVCVLVMVLETIRTCRAGRMSGLVEPTSNIVPSTGTRNRRRKGDARSATIGAGVGRYSRAFPALGVRSGRQRALSSELRAGSERHFYKRHSPSETPKYVIVSVGSRYHPRVTPRRFDRTSTLSKRDQSHRRHRRRSENIDGMPHLLEEDRPLPSRRKSTSQRVVVGPHGTALEQAETLRIRPLTR